MEQIFDIRTWHEYGLVGLIVFALFSFIYYITKQAREERKEWLQAYKEHTMLYDSRQAETNEVIANLTEVIRSKMSEEWNGLERRR